MERITKLGRRALDLRGDATRAADLAAAVRRAERELGPIAAAVHCAGIANATAAEDLPQEQWQEVIDGGRFIS